MKVWIVFEGEYSARRALAVFASEDLANRYAEGGVFYEDGTPSEGRDIESFEVHDVLGEPVTAWTCHTEVVPAGFTGPAKDRDYETRAVVFPDVEECPSWSALDPVRSLPTHPYHSSVPRVPLATSGTDRDGVHKRHTERVAQTVADWDIITADLRPYGER